MYVSFTLDRDDPTDHFMVVGTAEEWQEIMRNVDGIGHSPAMLELLKGLKDWGLHK